MKSIKKYMIRTAVALSVAAVATSCAMEEPFGEGAEGTLTINTEIKGDVTKTRAEVTGDQLAVLREKCVVYIENDKGVIRKYKGLDNIPQTIRLRTGYYVAEAWSGDSVSASFDSKFYRGWQDFHMEEGNNSLTLRCKIANVLVSVDPESLNVNLTDLKVTFSHSRGSLEFDEQLITDGQKGYFMMPNADKDLSYKVEGKKSDGSVFSKVGTIPGVQRAHEYCMTITEDETPITDGGALIRLTIADIPVIETEFEIFAPPAVRGVGFNIEDQMVNTDRVFSDVQVYLRGYKGLNSVLLSCNQAVNGITGSLNLTNGTVRDQLRSAGITIETRSSKDAGANNDGEEVDVDEYYVTFSKAYLEALPPSATEYTFSFEATDGNHKVGKGALRIANTFDAVEQIDPVITADAPDPDADPMAVLATSAKLTGYITSTDVTDYGIKYREQGTAAWSEARPSSPAGKPVRGTRAVDMIPYTVTITGLQPGKTYEYKSFCDGFEDATVNTFTTEAVFSIPNSSLEEWSSYDAETLFGTKSVTLPGAGGDKLTSFWGSGNEGSATAGMTLTDKSTDMVHSGTFSAQLASAKAMGILAAGNLFVGYYVETDGTNGVLSLGRPYNGSHPTKLRFYANYRPGTVDVIGKDLTDAVREQYNVLVQKGQPDYGQVYVALVDGAVDIRTKPSVRKLFDANADYVLAYGQVTWNAAFAPDGQLQMVEIPLQYNERANNKRPTHLVITASAAKYGDFFSGSSTSVMYLDDFELVYE